MYIVNGLICSPSLQIIQKNQRGLYGTGRSGKESHTAGVRQKGEARRMKQRLKRLTSIFLSLTLTLLLMVGMSIIVYGDNAYNNYLVTTDANKGKNGEDLNKL